MIEFEAMAGFCGKKDLEEMMLRGMGEFRKFWDNVRGILGIYSCLSLIFVKKK